MRERLPEVNAAKTSLKDQVKFAPEHFPQRTQVVPDLSGEIEDKLNR